MVLSRKTVRIAAGAMALSGPGTRPARVEVRMAEQGPSPRKLHAKVGQGQDRLLVGQVFSNDNISVRVMKT